MPFRLKGSFEVVKCNYTVSVVNQFKGFVLRKGMFITIHGAESCNQNSFVDIHSVYKYLNINMCVRYILLYTIYKIREYKQCTLLPHW